MHCLWLWLWLWHRFSFNVRVRVAHGLELVGVGVRVRVKSDILNNGPVRIWGSEFSKSTFTEMRLKETVLEDKWTERREGIKAGSGLSSS